VFQEAETTLMSLASARLVILLPLIGLISTHCAAQDSARAAPSIVFDGPNTIPAGACIAELVFRAVDSNGDMDTSMAASVRLSGLGIRTDADSPTAPYRPIADALQFESGVLRVTPQSVGARQLTLNSPELLLTLDGQELRFPIIQRASWLRLLPPILAIGLAIAFRDVVVSLVLAILGGCLLYFSHTEWHLAIPVFCETMVQQVADHDHASVILFTVLLGTMISLMNDSGGTRAAIDWLAKFARTRRRGMVLTWLMGLLVFFDDYANSMLIGGAMRPLSDRLKISRAKLAFLIDSTAAPIAGLAISTWTAFEIDQVSAGFTAAGIEASAASFFWSTIPYRVYPILAILVVAAVAFSGRDFGAMLRAEGALLSEEVPESQQVAAGSVWLAVLPVMCLITITVIGFVYDVDAYELLLIASVAASSLAFVLAVFGSRLSLEECSRSWMAGIASMMNSVTILVMAWGVSAVCQTDRLDTAGYIIDLVGSSMRVEFLPAIAFVVSGAIAFAIGSSFTTMALMVPMLLPLAFTLCGGTESAAIDHPVFAATIGAILAGAIFGDHCSPISDTTVLSSAAAGCDHLQHVATQLPYSLLTAVASVLLCYLPIGFGVPWWVCLPIAAAACVFGIVFLGKVPVPDSAGSD